MLRILNKCDLCKISTQISAFKCCINFVREKSFYSVLEIDSKASAKDIKSAYYKLSLQYHPDKNNGSPESVAKFREITQAYEVLGNPEKRKIYDQKGAFQPPSYNNQFYSGYYYRPRPYGGPYTGKTKDFNYDEHFRKHYQEDDKYRQAEYEYFKRRWEAEFHRRPYPDPEDLLRKRAETRQAYEEVRNRFRTTGKGHIVLFLTAWAFITIISMYGSVLDPERRYRRIYYKVDNEDMIQDD